MSTGSSNASFNVISGPLQGMQDSSKDQSMLQTVQDKAIMGVQEVACVAGGISRASAFLLVAKPRMRVANP